jgi:hypothetical protein
MSSLAYCFCITFIIGLSIEDSSQGDLSVISTWLTILLLAQLMNMIVAHKNNAFFILSIFFKHKLV